jgi:hypothetical protein
MRNEILSLTRISGVFVASLIAAAATAQAPRPAPTLSYPIKSQAMVSPEAARPPVGVGQIEIYEGPRRTVEYVALNLSPGERGALRDLARSENESAYADNVLALKRQYVDSERVLEPYRRSIQQQLYGFSTESTYSGNVVSGFGGGYGHSYPYAFANPYSNGFGGGGYFGGASTTVSRSLANGVGYEGPIKAAMASQIASQATPEFAAATSRDAEVALARVASLERLAKGFGVTRGSVIPAATSPSHVILTLKSGEKLEGAMYGEDADWFRVDTPTGTVSVRKADVTRVEVPKK